MSILAGNDDPEIAHGEADDLMAVVLSSLGYDEDIGIYNAMVKWYA